MTNPLDLRGPEFLQFYLAVGIVGLLGLAFLRSVLRAALPDASTWRPGRYPQEGDAYAVALLRGGREEAARAVLTRLIAADLVQVTTTGVQSAPGGNRTGLRPLEAAGLDAVQAGLRPDRLLADLAASLGPEFDRLETELRANGLLLEPARSFPFTALLVAALLLLPGLGIAKLLVALARGRSNVGFLIILIGLYTILVLLLLRPPRVTSAGARYLAWLKGSHQGLLDLLRAGRRANAGEVALAAGVFGLAPLTVLTGVGALQELIQREQRRQSAASGCSSASCSSGCGGGGCGGGGCGGCGGG